MGLIFSSPSERVRLMGKRSYIASALQVYRHSSGKEGPTGVPPSATWSTRLVMPGQPTPGEYANTGK